MLPDCTTHCVSRLNNCDTLNSLKNKRNIFVRAEFLANCAQLIKSITSLINLSRARHDTGPSFSPPLLDASYFAFLRAASKLQERSILGAAIPFLARQKPPPRRMNCILCFHRETRKCCLLSVTGCIIPPRFSVRWQFRERRVQKGVPDAPDLCCRREECISMHSPLVPRND